MKLLSRAARGLRRKFGARFWSASTSSQASFFTSVPHNPLRSSPAFTIVELLIVVVVIAILAALTLVSYNGISKQAQTSAMKSDLAQWKTQSELYKAQNNIICPNNYSFVYGNSTLGTNDFCVMKYEAKNDGSNNAVSTAAGTPWVNITQTAAITTAAAACTGCHLITEAEWMTIAADVLTVKYNWSGGAVGSGYIYQGHVNNNPASSLAASTDDTDTLNGITGGTGTTAGTNSSRVLWLKSGDAIWDFSGNVWEWTSQAQAMNQVGVSGDSVFNWRQWNNSSLLLVNLPTGSLPSALNGISGLNGIASWDSSKGTGQIYANYADTATRGFVRSGDWADTVDGGVLTLILGFAPSATGPLLGFRVTK